MRPMRLLLSLSTSFTATFLIFYIALSSPPDSSYERQFPKSENVKALFSFTSPQSLFPPSAIISLTDDNSTFFLARPAAFGPSLSQDGLSSPLWIGSGFGDDDSQTGELGCSDSNGSSGDLFYKNGDKDVESDPNLPGSLALPSQQSSDISGTIVLLRRGGCGFLAKVQWAQNRGARACIVADNVRGGGLIRMYAKGDTSNITIPSVFTSHTTGHLLSSLVPPHDSTKSALSHETAAEVTGNNLQGQTWWAKWIFPRGYNPLSSKSNKPHEGLWVTLTPTNVSSSPFLDTLLVLVVSPLVTLTVVYALLLLRSRIRRRRWRAPKSLVERLPVRTYHTINESPPPTPSPRSSSPLTPLLQHSEAQPISSAQDTTVQDEFEASASSSPNNQSGRSREEEKREAGLAEWRRRYGGRQKECAVCLDEYEDGVSQVMSLPCGHEFHAECITPWLVTRRRTCPICKGDVVRSLAQSYHDRVPSPPPALNNLASANDDDVQAQVAEARNDSPAASLPIPTSSASNRDQTPRSDDDVEANWFSEDARQRRDHAQGSGLAVLSSSIRSVTSGLTAVITRGLGGQAQRVDADTHDRDR